MKRAEKINVVESLNQTFRTAPNIVLASFRGLSVNQANDLRRRIGRVGGRYRVIQNRLARRAAEGTSAESLRERFAGPCAIATHDSDPVLLAKTLAEFAKDNPQVELLAALVEGSESIDAAGVKQLAKLPSLPELRAQLIALVQTPATYLVRLTQAPAGQLARVVDARRAQLEEGS